MAEWAQARRDAKTSPVQLDVKSLLKDAMKDGFDHHMAGAFAPCLQVFSVEQAGFPTFHIHLPLTSGLGHGCHA